MSDNATLAKRLETGADYIAARLNSVTPLQIAREMREAAARIAELEAEIARITAREQRAREEERERMLKLGLSFIGDQQAREDFIQLARSAP